MISRVERDGSGTPIGSTRVADGDFAGAVLDERALRDWTRRP